jgi:hypothetical protein
MDPKYFLDISFVIVGYGLLFSASWRVALGVFFLKLAAS